MPFGFEIPQPQPGNVSMSMNDQPPIDLGAYFGDAQGAKAPAANIPQEEPAMNFVPELQEPRPQANPGRPFADPQINQLKEVRERQEQERILSGIPVSEVERRTADTQVGEEELDELFNGLQDTLGENPPQRSEFQDEGETYEQQIERFRKNPMQYMKDHFNETFASMRAGLGETEGQKVRGFKNVFSDPETGASTAWKDGKIYVKYPNSNGYVPVGEKKFDVLQNMFLKTMMEASGPILEGVVGAGTEIGMGVGAAKLAAVGQPGLAAATVAAAPGVSGAAGVGAKYGARKTFDAVYGNNQLSPEESEQLGQDMLLAAGINYGMSGLMWAAKPIGAGIKQLAKDNSPLQALQRMKGVTDWYKDKVAQYSGNSATGSLREGAKQAYGTIDTATQKLMKDVRAVEDAALQRAGKDQKFSLKNTLDSMQRTLEDYRATIDPETGKVSFPEDATMAPEELAVLRDMGMASDKDLAESALLKRAEQGKTQAAFGQLGGKKELRAMADLFEQISAIEKTGGADMKTVFNYLDAFNFEGDLEKVIQRPGALTNTYRKFRNAASQDRALALEQTLKGSGLEEEAIFQSAYKRYAENIDDHMKLMKIFDSQSSAENFIRQTGKQSNTVEMMANVLGTDSPAWKRYKGEFLHDLVRESTDPSKGMFDGHTFVKKLMALPEGSRNTIFAKEEIKDLVAMARAAQDLPHKAFMDNAAKLDSATLAGFMKGSFLSSKIKAIMFITGRNYEVMKYLVEDGMLDQIAKAGTKAEKAELMAARRYMEDMMAQMRQVEVPRKGKMVRVLVPVAKAVTRVGGDKMLDKAMDNAKQTGVFMYPEPDEPQL